MNYIFHFIELKIINLFNLLIKLYFHFIELKIINCITNSYY